MNIVTSTTTISLTVAATTRIAHIIVAIHVILINTIITIIVKFVFNRIVNVIFTIARNRASIVTRTRILRLTLSNIFLSLLRLVLVLSSAKLLGLLRSSFLFILVLSSAPLLGLQDSLLPLQEHGLASGV